MLQKNGVALARWARPYFMKGFRSAGSGAVKNLSAGTRQVGAATRYDNPGFRKALGAALKSNTITGTAKSLIGKQGPGYITGASLPTGNAVPMQGKMLAALHLSRQMKDPTLLSRRGFLSRGVNMAGTAAAGAGYDALGVSRVARVVSPSRARVASDAGAGFMGSSAASGANMSRRAFLQQMALVLADPARANAVARGGKGVGSTMASAAMNLAG